MPVVSDRWPPADIPVTTTREASKPYSSALAAIHRRAHRQSSTAAGASATFARR